MRVLITGANGFVGFHLKRELEAAGYEVLTTDIAGDMDVRIDLLSLPDILSCLKAHPCDAVVHLAGLSSVALSWKNPQSAVSLNVISTLNLLECIGQTRPDTRLMLIGSSDEYGVVPPEVQSVDENYPLSPRSPYAVSKYTQEMLSLVMAKSRGLDVVLTRSFNHIGPGQRKGFVVSDFASAIAAAERGGEPVVTVGNLDVYRDFTDVRDVVRAYRLLLQKGKSGEVYNVGSGKTYAIRSILDLLIELSERDIRVAVAQEKIRPVELYRLCCNNEKLRRQTGWEPQIGIRRSLEDTMVWWRNLKE